VQTHPRSAGSTQLATRPSRDGRWRGLYAEFEDAGFTPTVITEMRRQPVPNIADRLHIPRLRGGGLLTLTVASVIKDQRNRRTVYGLLDWRTGRPPADQRKIDASKRSEAVAKPLKPPPPELG
jgi:hypothetical protein